MIADNMNPYRAPDWSETIERRDGPARQNWVGTVGLALSTFGVLAFFAFWWIYVGLLKPSGGDLKWFGQVIGACLSAVIWLGFLVSVIGLFWHPRRVAICGLAVAILGAVALSDFAMAYCDPVPEEPKLFVEPRDNAYYRSPAEMAP